MYNLLAKPRRNFQVYKKNEPKVLKAQMSKEIPIKNNPTSRATSNTHRHSTIKHNNNDDTSQRFLTTSRTQCTNAVLNKTSDKLGT